GRERGAVIRCEQEPGLAVGEDLLEVRLARREDRDARREVVEQLQRRGVGVDRGDQGGVERAGPLRYLVAGGRADGVRALRDAERARPFEDVGERGAVADEQQVRVAQV